MHGQLPSSNSVAVRADLAAQLAMTRRRLRTALDALAVLEAEFGQRHEQVSPYMRAFGLTRSHAALLSLFMSREMVNAASFAAASYASRHDDEQPDPKIFDVFTCHLRKRLRAVFGADDLIETVWGVGKRISAANKARIRARLAESAA